MTETKLMNILPQAEDSLAKKIGKSVLLNVGFLAAFTYGSWMILSLLHFLSL